MASSQANIHLKAIRKRKVDGRQHLWYIQNQGDDHVERKICHSVRGRDR